MFWGTVSIFPPLPFVLSELFLHHSFVCRVLHLSMSHEALQHFPSTKIISFSFQLCISGSLDYLVLLKKPFTFSSNVVFGSHNTTSKKCPVDKSKVEMTITVAAVGPNDGANESYKNLIAMHGEKCNVIRFSPAPYAQMCDIDLFNGILAVNDISIKANFERVCCYTIFNFVFKIKFLFFFFF